MASGKAWNRRAAVIGGATVAAGVTWALWPRHDRRRIQIADAQTLRRGNATEPESLDPCLSTGVTDDYIMGDLMTGLTTENISAGPIPGMATSWTTSDDGLTWIFKLREAEWSDGTPLTAADFVFAWQRLVDPATASPYAYFLYVLKNARAINAGKLPPDALGARAIDDYRLELHLEHPAPYLLQMMMHASTYPQPRHVVIAKGKEWARPGNHVGNGAFLLKEWIPNGYVLLTKNPRFYDAQNVALERVYFYPTDNYSAALQRMRAGELDTQDKFPVERIDWIKANIPETIDPVPLLVVEYIEINQSRPPFNDPRVREAVNLALNREAIAQRIRRAGDIPAYNLVPPGTANFPGGNAFAFKSMSYPARMERARTLMRDAGFGETRRLNTSLMIRSTAPGNQRAVAAAIQQMLAQVYVNLTLLPTDFQVFLAMARNHNFEMAEAGWSADFNDPATFLELFQTGGGNNDGLYSNPRFDAALASAQQDPDIASRGQKLAAAEAIVLNDHGVMPLYFWVNENIVWPYVKGWRANITDKHRSRWVSIDQAARLKQFT